MSDNVSATNDDKITVGSKKIFIDPKFTDLGLVAKAIKNSLSSYDESSVHISLPLQIRYNQTLISGFEKFEIKFDIPPDNKLKQNELAAREFIVIILDLAIWLEQHNSRDFSRLSSSAQIRALSLLIENGISHADIVDKRNEIAAAASFLISEIEKATAKPADLEKTASLVRITDHITRKPENAIYPPEIWNNNISVLIVDFEKNALQGLQKQPHPSTFVSQLSWVEPNSNQSSLISVKEARNLLREWVLQIRKIFKDTSLITNENLKKRSLEEIFGEKASSIQIAVENDNILFAKEIGAIEQIVGEEGFSQSDYSTILKIKNLFIDEKVIKTLIEGKPKKKTTEASTQESTPEGGGEATSEELTSENISTKLVDQILQSALVIESVFTFYNNSYLSIYYPDQHFEPEVQQLIRGVLKQDSFLRQVVAKLLSAQELSIQDNNITFGEQTYLSRENFFQSFATLLEEELSQQNGENNALGEWFEKILGLAYEALDAQTTPTDQQKLRTIATRQTAAVVPDSTFEQALAAYIAKNTSDYQKGLTPLEWWLQASISERKAALSDGAFTAWFYNKQYSVALHDLALDILMDRLSKAGIDISSNRILAEALLRENPFLLEQLEQYLLRSGRGSDFDNLKQIFDLLRKNGFRYSSISSLSQLTDTIEEITNQTIKSGQDWLNDVNDQRNELIGNSGISFSPIIRVNFDNAVDAIVFLSNDQNVVDRYISGLTVQRIRLIFGISITQAQLTTFKNLLRDYSYLRSQTVDYANLLDAKLITDEDIINIQTLIKKYGLTQTKAMFSTSLDESKKTVRDLKAKGKDSLSDDELEELELAEQEERALNYYWQSLNHQEQEALAEEFSPEGPSRGFITRLRGGYDIPESLSLAEASNYLEDLPEEKRRKLNPLWKRGLSALSGGRFGGDKRNYLNKATDAAVNTALGTALQTVGNLSIPGLGTALNTLTKIVPEAERKYAQAGALGVALAPLIATAYKFATTLGGFIGGTAGAILGSVFGVGTIPGWFVGTWMGYGIGEGIESLTGGLIDINSINPAKIGYNALGGGSSGGPSLNLPAPGSLPNLITPSPTPALATPTAASTQPLISSVGTTGMLAGPAAPVWMTALGTGGAALIIESGLGSAFLAPLPTINAEGELSKYVTIAKKAYPDTKIAEPADITYSITISADKGYDITINEISDELKVKYNKELMPDSEDQVIRTRSASDFIIEDQTTPITLPFQLNQGESITFQNYTEHFDSSYQNANITNNLSISFSTTDSDNETAKTAEVVCFGECPQSQNGCWPASGWMQQTTANELGTHDVVQAVDIRNTIGTNIYMTFNSSSVFYTTANTGIAPVYGNHVVSLIAPDSSSSNPTISAGFELLFGHMNELLLPSNYRASDLINLTPGQKIGEMGISGLSVLGSDYNQAGNSHLHYEIRTSNGLINVQAAGIRLEDIIPENEMVLGEFVRTCYE